MACVSFPGCVFEFNLGVAKWHEFDFFLCSYVKHCQPITIGADLGLDFAYEDTVPPVVDFTPAPAISSFTFHQGDRFAGWENDLLVGSLKARTLYRLRIRDGELVEQETLVTGLGRIRDVEMGSDGLVYLAIEHGDAGSLVRLVPAD